MPACHADRTCLYKHVFSCSANPGTRVCVSCDEKCYARLAKPMPDFTIHVMKNL